MATLARWQRTIVDDAGNILAGASVQVNIEQTGALAVLCSDRAGTTIIGNPFLADSEGFAGFFVVGGAYKITATLGAFSKSWRYVGIGTASEYDIDSIVTAKKAQVRAATTTNVTIATALNNGDVIDGVTLATNDLVLVKNQSSAAQNGVYVVGTSPARHSEFDTFDEHVGAIIGVSEGTLGANTLWFCSANAGGVLGTTAITFYQLSFGGDRYEITNWDTDRPASGEELIAVIGTTTVRFAAGLPESQANALTPSTGSAVYSIQKNGVQVGTLTFSAGNATGVFAMASDTFIGAGDRLSLIAPNPRDATLAGVSMTIVGQR